MIFTQTEGSIEQQAANMQAAIVGKPDTLMTSIVDNNAFTSLLQDARKQGITVIGVNVDATQGPAIPPRSTWPPIRSGTLADADHCGQRGNSSQFRAVERSSPARAGFGVRPDPAGRSLLTCCSRPTPEGEVRQ